MENNRKKLISILSDVCPDVDFENETALVDDGLIESLDIVAIVTEIMAEFDVEITVDDLLPDNFNSADALLAMIEEKMN
ncbi:MAG: acyl carrier protein [Ruminococcaceae bacterium]|nr:acyl carrier protein [Oscillospiraceae bacterium]